MQQKLNVTLFYPIVTSQCKVACAAHGSYILSLQGTFLKPQLGEEDAGTSLCAFV